MKDAERELLSRCLCGHRDLAVVQFDLSVGLDVLVLIVFKVVDGRSDEHKETGFPPLEPVASLQKISDLVGVFDLYQTRQLFVCLLRWWEKTIAKKGVSDDRKKAHQEKKRSRDQEMKRSRDQEIKRSRDEEMERWR